MAALWYCLIGQRQHGPFTSQQIEQLVQKGRLRREHYVRTETDSQWTAAGDLPGLFPPAQAMPPQPPGPAETPPRKKKRVGSPAAVPAPAERAVPVVSAARPALPVAAAASAGSPICVSPVPAAASGSPPAAPVKGIPLAAAVIPAADAPSVSAADAPTVRMESKPSSAARPIPLHPSRPAVAAAAPAPARHGGGTAGRPRSSRQQTQLLVGGLAAVLVLLTAVAVFVMNRGTGTKPAARSARATASAKGGGAATNANPDADPIVAIAPGEAAGTISDPPQAAVASVKEAVTDPKANLLPAVDKWLDAIRHRGGLRDIVVIGVGKAWLDKADGKPAILNVEIQVTNRSADEPLEFTGWRPDDQPQTEARATMIDDAGVALQAAPARSAASHRGTRRWIRAGESMTEPLSFVLPDNESKYFRLALPYAALGLTGQLGFELPRQMLKQGAADATEPAGPEPVEPAPETELPAREERQPKSGQPETIRDLRSEIEGESPTETEAMDEAEKPAAEEPASGGMKEEPKSP